MKTRLSILISLYFSALSLHAQEPLYRNFTISNGLPSNETHCIFEDNKGFIWIGTDNGIAKYDGTNFRLFELNKAPFNKTVFCITQAHDGTIWVSTYKHGIFKISNDIISEHPMNNKIIELTEGRIVNGIVATDSSIFLSCAGGYNTYIEIKDDKVLKKDYQINNDDHISFKVVNNKILHNSIHQVRAEDFGDLVKDEFILKNKDNSYAFATRAFMYYHRICKINDSTFISTMTDQIASAENSKQHALLKLSTNQKNKFYYLPSAPLSFYYFNDNKIIVGTDKSGVILLNNHNYTELIKGYTVTSIIKDKSGNLWMSTLKNGILFIDDLNTVKVSSQQYGSIGIINSTVYTTTEGNITEPTFKGEVRLNRNTSSIDANKNVLLYRKTTNNKSVLHYSIDSGRTFKPIYNSIGFNKSDDSPIADYDKLLTTDSSFILIGRSSASEFLNNEIVVNKYLVRDHKWKDRYIDGAIIGDTLFLASARGILKVSILNDYTTLPESTKVKESVDAVVAIDNKLYIAGKHLLCYDINHQTIHILYPNINNYGFNKLLYDKHMNSIWINGKSGLFLFNINNLNLNPILSFSWKNVGKINDIDLDNNWLFVATEKGLYKINTDSVKDKTSISTIITSKELDSDSIIYSNKNSITFAFTGINYSSYEPINYRYLLEGFNNDTIFTSNNNIQYTNLASGDYTFKVWASTKINNWTLEPIQYSFTIYPHFTETWWFIGLMILLGIIVISSIFLIIIRNLRRRNSLQKELIMTEQKALRAQMNPHFTFNALNSIQYFLTDNDRRSATTFLSKFSMLVRKVLYNSSENLIKLEEEIDTLRLYLDLEQLRFSDKLDIEINVDEQLDLEAIYIPSMIIQPFLENAIWHGIMPKEEGKGILKLDFSLENDHLVCRVTDNGIGREKSAELKSQIRKGHKSTGLKNIQERINVLNHINDNQIFLKINDLKSTDEQATGTEVIIIFEIEEE